MCNRKGYKAPFCRPGHNFFCSNSKIYKYIRNLAQRHVPFTTISLLRTLTQPKSFFSTSISFLCSLYHHAILLLQETVMIPTFYQASIYLMLKCAQCSSQLDTTKAMGSDGIPSILFYKDHIQQLSTNLLIIYSF